MVNPLLYSETVNRILILGWHNGHMNTGTVSASMRIRRRDALWLAPAVLLHAVVLLIPLQQHIPSATDLSRVVSVSLNAPRASEPEAEAAEPPLPPVVEEHVPEEPVQRPRAMQAESLAPAVDPQAVEKPPEPPATETTATLLDFAGRYKWPSVIQDRKRRLGTFVPQPVPENWRPNIIVEDNRFNGMVLPERIEIVDRWLAADGSHRVVINTPGGHTLCGRAQAYDPMNPLLEPIMSWWECGGGGKRTFTMPDRYLKSNRDRNSGDPDQRR